MQTLVSPPKYARQVISTSTVMIHISHEALNYSEKDRFSVLRKDTIKYVQVGRCQLSEFCKLENGSIISPPTFPLSSLSARINGDLVLWRYNSRVSPFCQRKKKKL